MKRKLLLPALSAFLFITITACGNKENHPAEPIPTSTPTPTMEAAITPEAVDSATVFSGISVDIPEIWKEATTDNTLLKMYYAETGESVAMLQLMSIPSPCSDFDEFYDYKDTFFDSYGANFDSFEITETSIYEIDGSKSMLVTFDGIVDSIPIQGKTVVFICESNNQMISINLVQSNNATQDYISDFQVLLDSIKIL